MYKGFPLYKHIYIYIFLIYIYVVGFFSIFVAKNFWITQTKSNSSGDASPALKV